MTALSNEHPIFDEVVGEHKTDVDALLSPTDWDRLREARQASHDAWFDQLEEKHRDVKRDDLNALVEHMDAFNRGDAKKVSKKAAAPKAPKARQKEATTNE